MSLYGDDQYSWGEGKNVPTEKQRSIINIIQENLDLKFRGNTSQEAYAFINNYYNAAKQNTI
jgi:hypothetical protein